MSVEVVTRVVDLGGARSIETHAAIRGDRPLIAAAHPADAFTGDTCLLLAELSDCDVIVLNPRGLGGSTPAPPEYSFESMIDELEAARRTLQLPRWIFWGMSGGGWLAQLYARRHPAAIAGVIIESCCACLRRRVADETCLISPYHPAWREALAREELLGRAIDDRAATEWIEVPGVGAVFRQIAGPALVVSPAPPSAAMKQMMRAIWSFDARGWLPELEVPALVIAGTADPIVPTAAVREVHHLISGSILLELEGASHVPTSTRHPELAAVVQNFTPLKATAITAGA